MLLLSLLFEQQLLVVQQTNGLREYVENGVFEPTQYGVSLVRTQPSTVFGAAHGDRSVDGQRWSFARFNPSVAEAPSHIKEGLMLRRTPRFIASFRHSNAMCFDLLATGVPATRHHRFVQTTLAVLDANFRILQKVVAAERRGEAWDCEREDVRLEMVVDGKILASGMRYVAPDYRDQFELFWIILSVDRGFVIGTTIPVHHADIRGPSVVPHARNLGVLWAGVDRPFRLVRWLGETRVDVRRGIPPQHPRDISPPHDPPRRRVLSTAKDRVLAPLHNGGTPASLDPWCPGLMLAVGHYHLDKMPEGTTKWGNTYVHHFLIFDASPPYAHVAASPPFCFRALSNASLRGCCEIIQFVSGFLVLPNATLLITYGVNDCEAAYVHIPLRDLLAFVDPRLLLGRGGACAL